MKTFQNCYSLVNVQMNPESDILFDVCFTNHLRCSTHLWTII